MVTLQSSDKKTFIRFFLDTCRSRSTYVFQPVSLSHSCPTKVFIRILFLFYKNFFIITDIHSFFIFFLLTHTLLHLVLYSPARYSILSGDHGVLIVFDFDFVDFFILSLSTYLLYICWTFEFVGHFKFIWKDIWLTKEIENTGLTDESWVTNI